MYRSNIRASAVATALLISPLVAAPLALGDESPRTEVESPRRGSDVVAPLIMAGTASDDGGVQSMRIAIKRLDTGQWWTGAAWANGYVRLTIPAEPAGATDVGWTYLFEPPATGTTEAYQVFPRAVDVDGNHETGGPSPWFRVEGNDSEQPQSTLTTPLAGTTLAASDLVTVSGSATDNTGVDRLRVTLVDLERRRWWNGSAWSDIYTPYDVADTPASATAVSWQFAFPPDAGVYQVFPRAVDVAGNEETGGPQAWFRVTSDDQLPPETVLDALASGDELQAPVTLSGTATDASGVAAVRLAITDLGTGAWWDGSDWSADYFALTVSVAPADGQSVSWQYNFDPTASGGSGLYHAFAPSVDVHGNHETGAPNAWFTARESTDTPPVTSIDAPAVNDELPFPVTISGTASDDAGVNLVRIALTDLGTDLWWDGSGWSQDDTNLSLPVVTVGEPSVTWQYVFDATTAGGTGPYQVFLRAQDVQGNDETGGSQAQFSAFVVPPNVPPIADAGGDLPIVDDDASGAQLVQLSGGRSSDPDGSIVAHHWSVLGEQVASGPSPQLEFGSGVHLVTLTVTDDDGATDSTTVAVNVYDQFVDQLMVTGLKQPVAMSFLPDGTAVVVGKRGQLSLFDPRTEPPSVTPYLSVPNVRTVGDNGTISIALAPDFDLSGHFYLYYTDDAPSRARLIRLTYSGAPSDIDSMQVIWESPNPVINEQHLGGALGFGPDGYLYLGLGDNFNPLNSQDLSTVWGSVIRLEADGTIPADNPFVDGDGPLADEIYAFGLRNPLRLSVTPAGVIRVGDVGGNVQLTAMEEFNEIIAQANYGWPQCEGPCALPGITAPWFSYPHAGVSSAVVEGFTYTGDLLPSAFAGTAWYADFSRREVRYLVPASNGFVAQDLPFLSQAGRVVWLGEGPDGGIYRIDIAGNIYRSVFDEGNRIPEITNASVTPASGPPPLTVGYSASATDAENDTLAYRWILEDGTMLEGASAAFTYNTPGSFSARLEVRDADNVVYSAPVLVDIGGPPSVSITTPANGAEFTAGARIVASASASDPDETLGTSNLGWTIEFGHNEHFHPVLGPVTGESVSLDIPTSGHDYSDETLYRLTVTATDSDGLHDSDTIDIYPSKAQITLATNVPGIDVTVDDVPHPTPFEFDDVIDFTHTVSVPATACIDNVEYSFDSWASGAGRDDVLTVDSAGVDDLATFTAGTLCDTTPPDTTVDYPSELSIVAGPVLIAGEAFDDLGVAQVRVRILDRTTELWWHGGQWQPDQRSNIVPVLSPGATATAWSYLFDPYATTTSLDFFVDVRAVDTFNNVDTKPDGERFSVEPPAQ